jgi:hypothetical protein
MPVRCSALLATVCIAATVHGQSLDWGRSVGGTSTEFAGDVAYGLNKSVITVGSFVLTVDLDPGPGEFLVTSNGSADVFIQVLDSLGNFLWGGSMGAGGSDNANGVAVDAEGNILVTGRVSGTVDIDPTPGTDVVVTPNTAFAVYVIKLSASGTYLWGRMFGSFGNDAGNAVAVDAAGNSITVGVLGGTMGDLDPGSGVAAAGGAGQGDAFVQKMDPNGNFLWGFSVGGTGADIAHGVCVDAADNILLTGEFRNTIDLDPGVGVAQRTSGGADDIFVLKVNAAGAFQWGHAFGNTGSERGRAIGVGPDGGPVFTGRITSVTDFDPGLGTVNLPGSNFEDAFVCKLNADGSLAWCFILASFLNEGLAIDVDELNTILITGIFGTFGSTALDLDPGPGTAPLLTNGGGDAFVASYNGSGSFLWGFKLGSAQNDQGRGVAWGADDRFAAHGQYLQTLDIDPGPNVVILTNAGQTDVYTAQYRKPDCAGVFVSVKAYLEGAYTPLDFIPQSDHLRQAGFIPLEEPYTAMGFVLEQPAATTPLVLTWTLSSAIVDWVLVEVRSAADPAVVLLRRAALLQRDGDVVAVDGVSAVGFCLPQGDYHIALRHRNHLGMMTATPVTLTGTSTVVDFRMPSTATFGSEARKDINGTMVMWAGNVIPDDRLKYTGAANDRDPILVRIGGVVPTNTVSGYWPEDVNMDGIVKYVGLGNDRDMLLVNIGGVVITEMRIEQLP